MRCRALVGPRSLPPAPRGGGKGQLGRRRLPRHGPGRLDPRRALRLQDRAAGRLAEGGDPASRSPLHQGGDPAGQKQAPAAIRPSDHPYTGEFIRPGTKQTTAIRASDHPYTGGFKSPSDVWVAQTGTVESFTPSRLRRFRGTVGVDTAAVAGESEARAEAVQADQQRLEREQNLAAMQRNMDDLAASAPPTTGAFSVTPDRSASGAYSIPAPTQGQSVAWTDAAPPVARPSPVEDPGAERPRWTSTTPPARPSWSSTARTGGTATATARRTGAPGDSRSWFRSQISGPSGASAA